VIALGSVSFVSVGHVRADRDHDDLGRQDDGGDQDEREKLPGVDGNTQEQADDRDQDHEPSNRAGQFHQTVSGETGERAEECRSDFDYNRIMDNSALRRLPAVSVVLEQEALADSVRARGRGAVLKAVRAAIEEARKGLGGGAQIATDPQSLAARSLKILEGDSASIRPVINATGVLLHTGLGRAPLAEEAVAAVAAIARGYCSLELELETGGRGRRSAGIERLICELVGAEAATAVNNNAGATVLALRALAAKREVIVSRGELVEIGGSFRLPEIFEVSGAKLREVGTTNKTRLSDYERAIGSDTAAILRVHQSNFRIVGFTEAPELAELVRLAHERGLWAIDDIGSIRGDLLPQAADEPTAAGAMAAGADLVLFSGDKLLGGPQCGIMAGSRKAVGRVESDPLMRALRLDKMTLAALEATLRLVLSGEQAAEKIPLWSMAAAPLEDLWKRATVIAGVLCEQLGYRAAIVRADSYLGGGSAPIHPIPTAAIAIEPPFPGPYASESALAAALRRGERPVIARVQKGRVVLDIRTVPPTCDLDLLDALEKVCHDLGGAGCGNGAVRASEGQRTAGRS
jgi:L-seryl-tRNA(Ser) seleniumtransferase